MKDTDELQRRLIGAYLESPDAYLASPYVGNLKSVCTGKWMALASILDDVVADGGLPNAEEVLRWMMAHPYDGPASNCITPQEMMDLPGSRSEQTIRGYERQIGEWDRMKRASVLLSACQSRIAADKGISDPAPAIAELVEALRGLDTAAGADVNHGQGLEEAISQANRVAADREAGIQHALWGVPSIDRMLPLEPGSMYVLAAAPKCGKTSLAMQAATATAEAGGIVAFASLEMRASDLSSIMAARVLGFDTRAFRRGMLPPEDVSCIASLADEWKKQDRILIRDTRADKHRCEDIKAWVKLRSRMRGRLSLVVIDYLQLMESSNPRKTEYEIVTQNTRSLKLMANSLNVPVLVLSQMNREGRRQQMEGGRKAGQVEPTMGSLRSSGSIEQDADAVCFLWSEREPEPNEVRRQIAFKVEANRRGETGRVNLEFFGPQQTFSDPRFDSDHSNRAAKLRSKPSDTEDAFNVP